MFKKLTSVALAALMLVGTTAVAVSAADVEEDAVAAAADTESVGADETDSNVGAETESDATGSGNVVYFEVPSEWSADTVKQGVFMYLYDFKDGEMITWGSKKGKMKDEGGGKYSFDLGDKGFDLDSSHEYGCIFAAGATWGMQTCDLLIGSECFGHTASCTGDKVENNVDSNKKSYYVVWDSGIDRSRFAPPLLVTSIGNIVGEALRPSVTKYGLFCQFLSETLNNARDYSGKSDQQLLDDIAKQLDLGQEDVKKAISETGVTVDWKASESSANEGSNPDSGSSGSGNSSSSGGSSTAANNSSSNGGSSSGSSSSSSSKTSSSSGSSSSGTSTTGGANSVSSGQESTIFFVFGGMMLAAAGILFLSRKKREY